MSVRDVKAEGARCEVAGASRIVGRILGEGVERRAMYSEADAAYLTRVTVRVLFGEMRSGRFETEGKAGY